MPIGDLLAQITGEPSPTEPTHVSSFLPPKRKADEQLRKPVSKVQRTQPSTSTISKPVSNTTQTQSVEGSLSRVRLGSSVQEPQRPISNSTPSATFKNGRPTPPLTGDGPKVPPKKGSFAEIMARAQSAQSTMGQIGKIQHKKIEKMPSRREREDSKAQKSSNLAKNLAPGSKFNKPPPTNGRDGQKGAKDVGKKVPPEPEKKIKKAATATTGYAGTARPKPGGTAPASRPPVSGSASRYDRGPDRNRYRNERPSSSVRYAYVSDEEEEEEEEEEREYDSDVSSDMEAAAFEVDEEEELATRIARREDAEALAEENRLKKEKEEKRKRLAAMAKSRPGVRY